MLITAKIYQLNTYNKVNLFNRRVPVIATIFWKNTSVTPQDFPPIIFSHPTRGIKMRVHIVLPFLFPTYLGRSKGLCSQGSIVHNHTKIKGLNSGKITSLPNLHASFQSSKKINHNFITRLICIQWKSSRFLAPVSTVSASNAWPTI